MDLGRIASRVGWSGRGRALALLGVAALAVLLAGWIWLRGGSERGALPQEHGRLAVPGLAAPLRIDRNRHGVPQIEAASESDAWFGLGFSHAQDRLGQILALRSRARGRAAERAGAAALESDRMARVLDFSGVAERRWEALPARARRSLEAYAAGVNARIARIAAGEAPPPPGWEGEALEPWRPQDSLALFKLLAWNLGASVEVSLVLQGLVGGLGAADAQRFFPPREEVDGSLRTAALPAALLRGLRDLRRAGGLDGLGVGSAAFVLGGDHTDSGAPLLVAESHSAPTLPAPFHLAHLRAPGLDVAGLTLPGVPVFWSGRNGRLAWASVHLGAVVTDLYVETLRHDASEYHDGRSWRPVEERVETIAVRGGAPVELVVRETARGPLLPGPLEAEGEALAVAWTGARGDVPSGIASLQELARSRDPQSLRDALARHGEPVLAVVWAHTGGEAGLQVAGWLPRRSLASQLLPLPGRARWYQWSERVPFADLPSERIGPRTGFLVAADQPFLTGPDGRPLDTLWRPGVRAERLRALLKAVSAERPGLRRAVALQADLVLPRSLALVERALALAGESVRGEESRALVRLLTSWDGSSSPRSTSCTAYHVFLDTLARQLFAEDLGEEHYAALLGLARLDLEGLVLGVLDDAAAGGGSDRWAEPERVREAVLRSLRAAWLGLVYELGPDPRRWLWGERHQLRFRDPLGWGRSLGPFPLGGAPHAVSVGGFSRERPFAFEVDVVATARVAVDLDAPDLLLGAVAPGQSEHPEHEHYQSGIPGWLSGRHSVLATRRVEIEEYSVARLELEPLQ